MMHFVRDSDAVGAILAGAGSRPAEELVTALRKGGYLRKYGRFGKPKQHWFRLSHDDRELLWDSSNGKVRSISLLSVSKIVQGQTTPVFRREPLPDYEAVSFSLLYMEGRGGGKERSLDLVCRNMQEFETWFLGIQLVIVLNQNHALQQQQRQQQQQAATNGQAPAAGLRSHSGSGSATPLRRQPSGTLSPRASDDKQLLDRIQEFKQIAASLQPVKAALSGGAGSSQRGGVSGPALAPSTSTKREIGDCYIWGSWLGDAEASGLDLGDGALQCCGLPSMVTNTHALDVIQVAVGARHAALTTRGGEVYTWGAGAGGNMGNGTSAGSNYPQQVTRLAGKGTAAVACGHSYTAAVLTDGALYSWGTGLGGQLGLGPSVTAAVWPTRILAGLEGVRVSQVSCGPYHAAAIGSDGRLFTWGDGLFGKLGHGDHCSAASPRFVTTLAEHWVISVSCGWWHTAAAAVARARLTGRGVNSSTSIDSSFAGESIESPASASTMRRTASNSGSFLRGNIVGTSPAPTPPEAASSPVAMSPAAAAAVAAGGSSRELPTASVLASRAADMGGAIFTWGGDFRWQQQTPWAKDNHQGCLGVGDLSGRLVPTLVKGEDNHVQVACGLNFTVALTNSGEVYQMGSTGAHNNREKDKADWKSALVPVLVRGLLSNHTAERLACGMSHVAVVATQRGKANSSSGSNPVTRLLTWGKNTAGQLGIGVGREDHFMPQIVSAVAGRRILFLTCGGNYTLAVCEHDPRARWSRDSLDDGGLGSLGLASATSGSLLVSGSGPSRMHLAGASALTPGGGSGGGPGAAMDRALAAAGGSGGTPAGGQRTAGGGGLTVSASLSSLASSVQSGSRGEGGGGGGGGSGGGSGLARKSDRGRLESRYSDRGFPVLAGGYGSGREQQQATTPSSKGLGMLTRSLDLTRSAGGAGAAQQQQQQGGAASNHVSWAPNSNDPSSSSRSLMRMGNSSKGFGGSFSSSSPSRAAGVNSSGLQLQDLSLQTLAGASKRGHHLPLPKSFKRLAAMGRSDSNSSSRAANWSDWQQQQQQSQHTRGPGVMALGDASSTPREQQHQQQQQWLSYGRTSSRQLSYSARSDQDLATVSATSSLTSAALSVTPSPSLHSMQEGRGVEGGLVQGEGQAAAGADDFQRQLRYWQERATNMEQQLSRRNHELESLRRELRFSSTSQGTAASDSTQHYSCSSLRPAGGSDRRSSGGGSTAGSSLAARRGLQALPPVITGAGVWALGTDRDEGPGGSSSNEAAMGLPSQDSSSARTGRWQGTGTGGAATGSASATPAGASSAGGSSASAAAAAGALVAAAMSRMPQGSPQQQQQQSQERQQQQQQRQEVPVLGSYPLQALTPEPPVSCLDSDSEEDAMQDAREDWASPTDRDGHLLPPAVDLPAAPSASSNGATAAAAAAAGKGPGSPAALVRDSSLATWMGGEGARVALLRSHGAPLANGSSAAASISETSDIASQAGLQQHQSSTGVQDALQQQQQQQVLASRVPRRSTGESSFVFAQVDRLEQELQQQQQGAGGLAGLRSASSVNSEDASPFTVAAAGSKAAQQQPQQRRHSQRQQQGVQQEQQEQLLLQQQQEMFRGMSEHSKEASRVLALFQESQRHRQQLEQQQQQQQPGLELPPLPASGNDLYDAAAGAAPGSRPLSVGAAAATVAAGAAAVAGRAGSVGSSAPCGVSGAGDALLLAGGAVDVAAAGSVSVLDVDALDAAAPGGGAAADRTGSPVLSPAAARELDLLRQQNRLLQQQLQELRQHQQQQQQQQQPGASAGAAVGAAVAVAASGPGPAPVTVVAGRSSFGPGGSSVSGSGLAGTLSKHRKTGSAVDIGSCPTLTHEVARGVYLSLQALPQGGYELKRVRFAKQVFSSEDAEQWWATHRERVYAAFNISQQQQQQQAGQQQDQPPEQQQQVAGGVGAGSSSSAGRVLVFLANPFPLGGAPANAGVPAAAASGAGLREGYVKRASNNNGDWTPPLGPSPCFDASSPQSSTLELETLQLPPSALLDAAFAQAESEQQQQLMQQQWRPSLSQQQQQNLMRGWPAICVSADGPTVSRSSSLGPVGAELAAAAAAGVGGVGSKSGPGSSRLSQTAVGDAGDPHGASQQQGPSLSSLTSSPVAAGSVLSGAGSGIESVWQPVLPRKMSAGPDAADGGPDVSTSPGAAAASSSAGGGAPVGSGSAAGSTSHGHHKRSGSGLFRWLSKQQQQQQPGGEGGAGPSSNGGSSSV